MAAAAVQQAREAAAQEQAALAAKVAAAEEAAAAARQEAEGLRQRRVQEMEALQGRLAGLLQVRTVVQTGWFYAAQVCCVLCIWRHAAHLPNCLSSLPAPQTKDSTIAALTQQLEELHAAVA